MIHNTLGIMILLGALNIQPNGQKHILDIRKEDSLDTLQPNMLDQDNGKDYSLLNTQDTLLKIGMHSMLGQDSLKESIQHITKDHMQYLIQARSKVNMQARDHTQDNTANNLKVRTTPHI